MGRQIAWEIQRLEFCVAWDVYVAWGVYVAWDVYVASGVEV